MNIGKKIGCVIADGPGYAVIGIYGEDGRLITSLETSDAVEIHKRFNMHDDLVDALESMIQSHGENDCRFVRGCCQEHFDLTGDGNCYVAKAKETLKNAKRKTLNR